MNRITIFLLFSILLLETVSAEEIDMNNKPLLYEQFEQRDIYLNFDGSYHVVEVFSFQNRFQANLPFKINKRGVPFNQSISLAKNSSGMKNIKAYDEHGYFLINTKREGLTQSVDFLFPSENIELFPNIIYFFTLEYDIEGEITSRNENSYVLSTGSIFPSKKMKFVTPIEEENYVMNLHLPNTFWYSSDLISVVPLPNSFSYIHSSVETISFSKKDLETSNYSISINFRKIANKTTIYGLILMVLGGVLSMLSTIIWEYLKTVKFPL